MEHGTPSMTLHLEADADPNCLLMSIYPASWVLQFVYCLAQLRITLKLSRQKSTHCDYIILTPKQIYTLVY